jgi:lipopolysaccharide/colanic/teichoic acid biosynthesis glycosyltransferase
MYHRSTWAKRALDLLLAGTAGESIMSALLALICLAIKLEGRSPSILLQRRAFNGREFAVYNFTTTIAMAFFRSMSEMADTAGTMFPGTIVPIPLELH